MSTERARRPRPRRPNRLRRSRLIVGIALLLLAFLLGVALGQALHDNPKPGQSATFVRTFQPLPSTATVTVTTSG